MPGQSVRYSTCGSRIAWQLVLALVVLGSSGCASLQGVQNYIAYNDTVNDFVMGWRNSVWARQAWHERKWQFTDQHQFVDFGEGFRAGYVDVASGSNGCPPALPPRNYWNWKYQTPEGQAKVAAWFSGYPHGARAAEEDGAGLYQNIQVSHFVEKQYSPEFLAGLTPATAHCFPEHGQEPALIGPDGSEFIVPGDPHLPDSGPIAPHQLVPPPPSGNGIRLHAEDALNETTSRLPGNNMPVPFGPATQAAYPAMPSPLPSVVPVSAHLPAGYSVAPANPQAWGRSFPSDLAR